MVISKAEVDSVLWLCKLHANDQRKTPLVPHSQSSRGHCVGHVGHSVASRALVSLRVALHNKQDEPERGAATRHARSARCARPARPARRARHARRAVSLTTRPLFELLLVHSVGQANCAKRRPQVPSRQQQAWISLGIRSPALLAWVVKEAGMPTLSSNDSNERAITCKI